MTEVVTDKTFEKFPCGLLVKLHGSAVVMTVRHVVDVQAAEATGGSVGVECDWFDWQGCPHQKVFLPNQLVRVPHVTNT